MTRTSQRDFEIVVAHFKENLDWTKPYHKHLTIYHKNPQDSPSIPNVGRESHTYLHHIIQNYDDLATMTLFTQGSIHDIGTYQPLWFYGLPTPFRQKTVKQFSQRYKNKPIQWGKLTLGNYSKNMRPSPYTFGEWWDKYLQIPRPTPNQYYLEYKAVFSVHRDVIRSHPKSYYENLISCINDHPNPEEGHYFERSWAHIFCGLISK